MLGFRVASAKPSAQRPTPLRYASSKQCLLDEPMRVDCKPNPQTKIPPEGGSMMGIGHSGQPARLHAHCRS